VGGIESSFGDIFNLTGDIAELIIYSGYLSDADLLAVRGYLEQKYGLAPTVTSSLPVVSSGTLHLWLKADAGVITNASGQVSQWEDQSGNANHASQANANKQPLLVYPAGLGGRAALRFNGIQDGVNGDYLQGTGNVGVPNALTTFAVYNSFSNEANGNVIWAIGQPQTYGALRSDTIYDGELYFSTWTYDYPFPFLVATNTYRIWTTALNSNLTSVQVYDNTATTATNFSATVAQAITPAPGYYVGGLNPAVEFVGSSRCFDGDIVELICYSGYLSEGDRLAVLGYLEQKYYPPCVPYPATATTTVVNGFVVGVTVTDGGCGYTNAPVISFAGGGGTGATATAVVTNGAVAGITITDPGTGYTSVPTVDITPPASVPPPSAVPFTNSLVAYYPFDGNANDATGHGNNGQIIGDVVPATDRFGNASSAYHFNGNGSDSAIEVTNTLFNIGQEGYTISGWFASDNVSNILQILWNSIPETGVSYALNDGTLPPYAEFAVGPATPDTWTDLDVKGIKTNYANQTWYQFVFVKSGTTYTTYINGTMDSLIAVPAAAGFNDNVGFIIGSITAINPAFPDTFFGRLDDYRVYNRALSPTEVQELYAYESVPEGGPCVPYPATATATVVNGSVAGVTVTDGGCGYTNTPVVLLVGGGGTGATAIAIVTNGVVVGITITDPGTEYTSVPTVDITPLADVPPPSPVPFTNSLVAYYPFDGNANDASGNGNNGTPFGTTAFGADRFGNTNSCLSLSGGSGDGSGVVVPSLSNAPLGNLTYSAWFVLSNLNLPRGATLFMPLMGRVECDGEQCGAICVNGKTGIITNTFIYYTGGATHGSQEVPPLNTWCQVVFTLDDSGDANFYLNGTSVPGYGPAPISPPMEFCIGAATGNDCGPAETPGVYVWNGLIDDVRVYNRVLSSNEVQELYAYESVPGGQPQPCIPSPATATATVVNGFVVGVTVTDGGCGYTNAPVVSLVGGGGTGAAAIAVVTNGVVVGITITDPGTGYTSTPTVVIYSSIISSQIGLIRAVIPTFSSLSVGLSYQLQVSSGLNTWTNYGSSFVATNAALIYPQSFSVTNWDQLFFRLLGSP
jgi:hypothetical protein